VKQWASARGCNNAQNSMLSSYAWMLLAIHFLQCGCPILPNLSDPTTGTDAAKPLPANDVSVGQLLLAFFVYYGVTLPTSFDITRDVASVAKPAPVGTPEALIKGGKGSVVAQAATKPWRICIEDPFEVRY
jgi:DNA polymerase sigma